MPLKIWGNQHSFYQNSGYFSTCQNRWASDDHQMPIRRSLHAHLTIVTCPSDKRQMGICFMRRPSAIKLTDYSLLRYYPVFIIRNLSSDIIFTFEQWCSVDF